MTTTCCFFLKDSSDTLDYSIEWNLFLPDTDAITNSEWTDATGITIERNTFTARSTHIWLSGGSNGTTYVLTNKIWTREGRVVERSIAILITER